MKKSLIKLVGEQGLTVFAIDWQFILYVKKKHKGGIVWKKNVLFLDIPKSSYTCEEKLTVTEIRKFCFVKLIGMNQPKPIADSQGKL
jgi:hypothetical protein